VLTLGVTPVARQQGFATCLLREAKAVVGSREGAAMFLEVATSNVAALALYRREGFLEVGCRQRYYADGSDAVVMRVNLL
jgi:ribosomal-protein-alanine N-acetyltransferase